MGYLYSKEDFTQNLSNLTDWQLNAFDLFSTKLSDKERKFPCIPATQGYFSNQLRYGFVDDPRKKTSGQQLAYLLKKYTQKSRELGDYTSLIIFCDTPLDLIKTSTIVDYENIFWSLLNETTKHDIKDWPSDIPTDPNHHIWEFCFHGEQYFVYCGTPGHVQRQSRSFPYLLLAITPRWVLEKFNSGSKHVGKVKKSIRKRLQKYDSIPAHPNLNMYGQNDNFEWKQYFLRDDQSTAPSCPFSYIRNTLKSLRK
ncbi:YqcI/YcgG family protein [Bacillus salitolerans]|uniref:YqcI/YcgG family protein n=1 Tax=Bacillus salitolerans TaxID=1437434 RepID=A0ABW4LVH7_9BACI